MTTLAPTPAPSSQDADHDAPQTPLTAASRPDAATRSARRSGAPQRGWRVRQGWAVVGVIGVIAAAVIIGGLLMQPARNMTAAPMKQSTASAGIVVEQPWARAATRVSDAPSGTSAVYMTLRNTGATDDRLLGAASDVAVTTEVHRTSVEDGVMRMRPAGPLDLPVGGALTLEPGGLHVMLIDIKRDLAAGERLTVTLQFEQAGDVTVDADVRAPMSGPMSKPMHGG